ncbi:WD repeat domain phosphoinositide-interacting protein 4 [Tritrichomonas foetus]|uniref:WD repeat domain phosphoinositide-interacting protein 4 n=1 Tax=Tritrichomonas foetus TaxID=1144522 RepID=A0A1J4JRN7_9EUKA|nr:WD repeat domain phosphoinositide-interacting protein 4 [Tritrichomonas foetus]|eukprot:OHT00188.1 WD repeat domain phosphoinositide-interacting protein 4 [Tritrichomonas foetus]
MNQRNQISSEKPKNIISKIFVTSPRMKPLLNSVQFTNDAKSICTALPNGFAVLTLNPIRKRIHRFYDNQQFGNAVTIPDSNIIVFTGVSGQPELSDTSICVFDESIARVVLEIKCRESIRNIVMLPQMFAFSSKSEVRLYTFEPPVLYCQFRTSINDFAPLDFVESQKSFIVAFSGRQPGTLRIIHGNSREKQDISIYAHKSPLAFIKLNANGTLVATASSLGTIIKVYNTKNGELIGQFRRGSLAAEIRSISFSPESELLAVSSSKGTIHVFSLSTTPLNPSLVANPLRADMKISKLDLGSAVLCFESRERLIAVSSQCILTNFIVSEIDKTIREDKSYSFANLIAIQE